MRETPRGGLVGEKEPEKHTSGLSTNAGEAGIGVEGKSRGMSYSREKKWSKERF